MYSPAQQQVSFGQTSTKLPFSHFKTDKFMRQQLLGDQANITDILTQRFRVAPAVCSLKSDQNWETRSIVSELDYKNKTSARQFTQEPREAKPRVKLM